jgi:hypothetical protein
MSEHEFRGKFLQLSERVLGAAQANELYDRARSVQDIDDIADLGALLSPARPGGNA